MLHKTFSLLDSATICTEKEIKRQNTDDKLLVTTNNVKHILSCYPRVLKKHLIPALDSKSLSFFASSLKDARTLAKPALDQRKLFGHIVNGEKNEVKMMLDANPSVVLEKCQTEYVVTNKGGQHIQLQGKTAYQFALGEEDTEIAAMLKDCVVKVANVNEADAQYNAQFPQEWEETEAKRYAPVFTQFKKLINAICNAASDITSSSHPEYKLTIRKGSAVDVALTEYRNTWDKILSEAITTGRHYNPKLLQQAFISYKYHFENYFRYNWSDPSAMCFWQLAIGYAQRSMPVNYVQAFCDSLYKTIEKLKKCEPQDRSLRLHLLHEATGKWAVVDFYPFLVARLGFDLALAGDGAFGGGPRWMPDHGSICESFTTLCQTKTNIIQSLLSTKKIEDSPLITFP